MDIIQTQENGTLVIDLPNVFMRYEPAKKEIFARDKRDLHNEPACYSTVKRPVRKTWDALVSAAAANHDITHRDVMSVMNANNCRYHYWCMVD